MAAAELGMTQAQYDSLLSSLRSNTNIVPTAKQTGSVPLTGPTVPVTAKPTTPVSASATGTNPPIGPPAPSGGRTDSTNPGWTVIPKPVAGSPDPVNQGWTIASPSDMAVGGGGGGGGSGSGGGGGGQSAGQSFIPPDYAALAAARTAASLAQKRTIAEQQKKSADTAYNQQNLRTKDDRILGDFSRTQTATPFGNMGRTSFQESLIGRERTQADADASAALVSQKANIDQLLASYENATADEQVRIADELQRADRAYQLDLAQFQEQQKNNEFNQGMQNKQFDRGVVESDRGYGLQESAQNYNQDPNNPSNYGQTLQNQLNELKLGNYPAELKQQATLYEQQVAAGKMSNEAAAYNLKQLKDPNSPANQAQKLDLQMKQLEAKNLPEKQRLELQQLKKQIAEIGVVHYKPQTATEIEMDKVNLQAAQAKLNELQNPSSKAGVTAEEYDKNLKPQYDNYGKLTNAQQIEDQIILSGMSDWEQYKAYKKYNLVWDDPIPTPGK